MEIYFEHLINAVYQAYQDILTKKHGNIYPLRSAVIKFGGFQFNYPHQRNPFKYFVCLLFSRLKEWYS